MKKQLVAVLLCLSMVFGTAGAVMADETPDAVAGAETAIDEQSAEYALAAGVLTPIDGNQTPSDGQEKTDISKAAVTIQKQTYTGKALTPAAVVKVGNKTLTANKDYKVAYSNNINAGTAKATITGIGSYKGTCAATFKIKKAASTINLKAKTAAYTGKKIKIGKAKTSGSTGKVTYTYYSDKACKKKVTAAKKPGTYYVIASVAADANYKKATSAAVKLTIKKAAQPMKVKGRTVTLSRAQLKKKAKTVKASKAYRFTKKAKGTVTYKKVKGSKKITVDKKTGKITVGKGLKKGTHKIKVKITANGNKKVKNYKSGSKTVTVTIKVKK